MKIDLTPAAARQTELIADMTVIETGFVIGGGIGKHIIVEHLFPVNFNENNINEIYAKMLEKMGIKLLGVFFNNTEPFHNDWFLNDVIIKINPPHLPPKCYIMEAI